MNSKPPRETQQNVAAALQQLPEMHRLVIAHSYGLGGRTISRKRLALQLGVPLERLDSIRDEALRMLRQRPAASDGAPAPIR